MRDHYELGSTPSDEDCVQVNPKEDYIPSMTAECQRYKELLEKKFPNISDFGCYFKIKTFPHDFGSYREVCIIFDPEIEVQQAVMCFVESNLPATWKDDSVHIFKAEEANVEEAEV